MKKIAISVLVCALVLVGIEWWLRAGLFEHASYSNSQSIDSMVRAREQRDDWTMIFVGDSETHWGINPVVVDEEFAKRGMETHTLNHAFDGFGPSWWVDILPPLLETDSLRNVKAVAVGVQMIDAHQRLQAGEAPCGALQKPVLTSPMGVDLGVDALCGASESWDAALGRDLFGWLWTVRYSSAVRSVLLPSSFMPSDQLTFNSAKVGEPVNGYEAHRAIGTDTATYLSELERWKAQYNPAEHFRPLPPEVWNNMTSEGGFFDELKQVVEAGGAELVLFALPTNPVVFDTFNRREDYLRHSGLLRAWSKKRGVVFVDLGIRDSAPVSEEYSDMRHLSGRGAEVFSRQLGAAMASEMSVAD